MIILKHLTRRQFLKNSCSFGIGAASAYIAENILNPAAAFAASDIPSAIRADPDNKISSIWNIRNKGLSDEYMNLSTRETILAMMRLIDKDTRRGKVEDFTLRTSHAYYLICAQLNNGEWIGDQYIDKENNRGLNEFSFGVGDLYSERDKNEKARWRFANGIFTASKLQPDDYKRMNKAGIKTRYDDSLSQNKNALILAQEFLNADLDKKELMLNIGIWEKFKNVKADNKCVDINNPSYHMKSMYWNLGFYVMSEYKLGNQNGPKLSNSEYYKTLSKVNGYHTISNMLLV